MFGIENGNLVLNGAITLPAKGKPSSTGKSEVLYTTTENVAQRSDGSRIKVSMSVYAVPAK